MKKNIILLLTLTNLLFSTAFGALPSVTDSLEVLLQSHQVQDTVRVNLLNELAIKYVRIEDEKLFEYATESIRLAEKLNYTKGIARSSFILGFYWHTKMELSKSLMYYEKSLKLNRLVNEKKQISYCLNNIGLINKIRGNYSYALECYMESLDITEELSDIRTTSYCLNNIGNIYKNLNNDSLALVYFVRSLKIKEKIDDEYGIATTLINIGHIYKRQDSFDLAIDNYKKSLKLSEGIDYKYGVSVCLLNIGGVHLLQKDYTKALDYFEKSLVIKKELGDEPGICELDYERAILYQEQKNYAKSLKLARESLELAKKHQLLSNIKELYLLLSEIYAAKKNYKDAYESHLLYKRYSDTLFNEESIKDITSLELQNKYNHEKELAELKQKKIDDLRAIRIRRQLVVVAIFISGFLLTILVLFLMIRLYRSKRKTNFNLSRKNDEINRQKKQLSIQKEQLEETVKQRTFDLIKEKEKAEESDRLKTAFLNNISHEFRTPMNGILGFSSLLVESKPQEPERKKYADIIKKSCNQLLNIVNDTVEISKVQSQQIDTVKMPLDISSIISEVISEFQVAVQLKGLEIKQEINLENQHLYIESDVYKFRRVFWHLISNAVKFTQTGYIEVKCELEKNDLLKFQVKDTGIGIKGNLHEEIFKPFMQVETGLTRNFGGNGIGLSLVKAYIEVLNGTIWLESIPAKGTSVFFTLPAIFVKEKAKTSETVPDTKLENITILIAEDNELNYLFLQKLLIDNNCKILHAWNGMEAVQIFKEQSDIDLILMDLKMPIMDGHEAFKEIKKINSKVPIIAQTAYAPEHHASIINFDGFITKPMEKEELLKTIKKCLK